MKKLLTRSLAALLLIFAGHVPASFHLWQISEIYSNADGTVQFIELATTSGGQQFLAGHNITSRQGTASRSFTFLSNLPGDSSFKSFLIGTQGFAALGVVQPDYIVPNGFLFTSNASVDFAGVDSVTYTALPTTGGLSINATGATAVNSPRNFAGASGTVVAAPAAPLNYSDLWWVGKTEDGWGMTVQQHGNIQFNVFFVYDGTGKPIWYAMPGGTWNSDFTVFSGGIAKPTSAPLNAYDKTLFQPGGAVGTMAITYTSPSTARLNYTIGGVSGQKNIQRQVFGQSDGITGLTVGDMWWAGATQDGWGVSITQQLRTLFAAWYTYDQAGNVTWYTLPGGTWSGNTYTGTLATATSSPWLGVAYDPSKFVPAAMGTISFTFTDANNGVMNYTFTAGPFAGTTQTKQIVRQPY